MSFAARQRQLMDLLRWAPTRGPKRQALIAELQQLVRDELKRETTQPVRRQAPDLFETRSMPAEDDPRGRRRQPYWMM